MPISSHLLDIGNHSSVYSACTEIASKWEELGSRLSVYRPSVETIRADGEDVSDCLMRLVDVWLKRSSPDQPLPSWRRLCDALSYLNRTLSEKVSSQHQCGCLQCTAVEMLFQQYKELCEKMKDPVTIAEYMYTEDAFTLEQLERITGSSGDEKEALFTAMESVVSKTHYNLKIFATALLMEQDTFSFGKSLLSKYKNERNFSQHTKEIEVNMEYSIEFQKMRNELGKLCGTTLSLLKERKVEMSSFTFELGLSFLELRDDFKRCTSLPEAMAEVIRPRVSLIQIDFLEIIYENFALPRDSIDAYKKKIESFCNTIKVDHAYGQDLMNEFTRHVSKLESITFTLNWEGNEDYLRDLLGLFEKLFGQYSKRVKVKFAFPKNSFDVQCYVPSHLQPLIVRMIQQKEKILHEEKVLSVTAGGVTVFTKASQVSKSSIEMFMEDITKVSDDRDDISDKPELSVGESHIRILETKTYQRALAQGQADVAYSRVMLLGPGGVGKTSLKRGLMGQPFDPTTNSTIVADVQSVRPVSRTWMKAESADQGRWCEVSEEDEIEELAQLMKIVGRAPGQSPGHVIHGVMPHQISHPGWLKQLMESDIIQKAISKAMKMEEGRAHQLKCQPFYHLWDCGGQPVFLEFLPAFLTSHTMFLILFNAAKDLHQQLESVHYKGGKKVVEGLVGLTTQELIERWISCIYHHLLEMDGEGVPLEYPRVIPVGTRGDLAEKDKVLKQLEQSFNGKRFHHVLKDPIIIDNTTAGKGSSEDRGYQYLREEIFKFTSKGLIKKTPIAWVLFRKYLQLLFQLSEENSIISLYDAVAIGSLCNIAEDDLPSVLKFYHDLGVILYYPHIRSLSDKVILNPSWFVDCLGKVLTLPGATLEERYEYKFEWNLLRSKGILVKTLYTAVWRECKGIKPEEFIELLTSFQLAVQVKTNEYFNQDVKQYFVPAVLPYSSTLPTVENSVIKAASLHITFNTGFVTPGFFTHLAVMMVHEGNDPKLELYFKEGIYHDMVTYKFECLPSNYVTLTESSSVIKIDFACYTSMTYPANMLKDDCTRLKKLSQECCEQVEECLQPSKMKTTSFEMKVVCQAKKCELQPTHYLVSEPYKQEINGTTHILVSCENEKYSRDILPEEAYWYGEHKETSRTTSSTEEIDLSESNVEVNHHISASQKQSRPVTKVDVADARCLLKNKTTEWDSFGRELGIDLDFREGLRQEGGTTSNDNKLERVLAKWSESHCSEVSWDTIIKMLEDLKFVNMAQDVKDYLLNNPDGVRKYGWKQ